MIACVVLRATYKDRQDLVVVEVPDEVFAQGWSPAAGPELELLEFLRLGPRVRADRVLVFIGFGRVEPWRDLPDGSSAARVERIAAN